MNYVNKDFEMGFIQNLITPEVKGALVGSAKESASNVISYVWQEYKIPIILTSTILAATIVLSNAASIKILTSK
jgi:hypothetical protein